MQNGGLLMGHLIESNNNILAFTATYNTFILQARLQQYVNHEFPDVQAGDRKSTRLNSSHSGQSRMPSSA